MIGTKATMLGVLVQWIRHTMAASMLQALQETEERYRTNVESMESPTQRVGNVDVFDSFAVCNVIEMNWHSIIEGRQRTAFPHPFPRQVAAAIALAAEHINSGNGIIVSELAGLNETCNIRFTSEFHDTAGSAPVIVETLTDILNRPTFRPCAFIGAFQSSISVPTSILTGVAGFPQITATSASPDLDNKSWFPLFGRAIPSASKYGLPLLQFLHNEWNIRHVGVFHDANSVGSGYLAGLQAAANLHFPDLTLYPVSYSPERFGKGDEDELALRMQVLKSTGLRFFFLIGVTSHIPSILDEAHRQGIAGTATHNWLISDPLRLHAEYDPSSQMSDILPGLSVFYVVHSQAGVGGFDKFQEVWTSLANSTEDLVYLDDKLPRYENTSSQRAIMDSVVFEKLHPYVPLFYDILVLIALSACSIGDNEFTGEQHFQSMMSTMFVGASGTFLLDPQTGSRMTEQSMFALVTYVPSPLDNGNITFVTRRVAEYNDAAWDLIDDPFFNDNTTKIPLDLPELHTEYNRISGKLRATGIALCFVVLLTSIAMSVWTCLNQKSRVIKASQPLFLHIICLGAALMGLSIIPTSVDDGVWDDPSLACFGHPVLVTLGWSFAFAALFSKTRLVNKVFHKPAFTILVIRKTDVFWPMALLVGVNAAILTVWYSCDPLSYERKVTSFDAFGRPVESVGSCQCRSSRIFWVLCSVLNIGALGFTCQQAFIARKIATEFAESECILQAMSVTLVVSSVAFPVMAMVQDDPRAFFFVRASFTFLVSMSLMLFLFVSKILYFRRFGNDNYTAAVKESLMRLQKKTDSRPNKGQDGDDCDKIGTLVLDHPKLRRQQQSEFARLLAKNQALEAQLVELGHLLEHSERSPCSDRGDSSERPLPSIEGGKDISEGGSDAALRDYLRVLYG